MLTLRIAWDRPARPPEGLTEHTLLIGLTPQAGLVRLPLHLCLLLDCSQSMSGAKLEEARAACRLAAECLQPDDLLSLVAFSSRATPRFAARPRADLSPQELEEHLAALQAEGTTRTDLALAEGARALRPHAGPGRASLLLLVTDGHPTDPKGKVLTEYDPFYGAAARLASEGIALVTVGLGDARHYNAAFLTALADRGKGRFCYAPEPAELGRLLRGQIEAAQATVVSGVEIALMPKRAGVSLTGFCQIRPRYLPCDLPQASPDGAWHLPCASLEAGGEGSETVYLALMEVEGMFGMPPGLHPVVGVSASCQPAAGPRQALPEVEASLRFTLVPREQQEVCPEAQQLRQLWDLNEWQDELGRTGDPRQTGQLMEKIGERARELGMQEVAAQAREQLERLRETGRLDADRMARSTMILRDTGRLLPAGKREPVRSGTGELLKPGRAALEFAGGRQAGVRLPLDRERCVLGRGGVGIDIDLSPFEPPERPLVSRRHAELWWEGGQLLVRDLGSTNGTFVNGERLPSPGRGQPGEPYALKAGDLLKVADLELRVVDG